MSPTVQSLWIGAELSTLERLSISSFLHHGHAYHLYVYGDVDGIPAGTTVCDGRDVLPESAIFQYRDHPSYSGFSNFFRYRLLLLKGGWWVDTDVVCLRPFEFDALYVFGSEVMENGDVFTSSGVLKAPAGSPLMRQAWETCRALDAGSIAWGEIGPDLVTMLVERLALGDFVEPPETFSPVAPGDWQAVLDSEIRWELSPRTYAVHLWNEQWRRHGREKNGRYPPGCLYERLKARYAV